jgi:uncharacterized protein (DUF305 family)
MQAPSVAIPAQRASGRSHWLAAAMLGFLSSSYSTAISQLTAPRLGRDAAFDWMSVAAIPARDWALMIDPSPGVIAVGIAFHQWADFSWALVFFGVFGRWTARLRPQTLAWIALPWALLTSSIEWFGLVPLLPFWQPIFPLQQPLWIGFLVHFTSALMYPVFPWLHQGHAALAHRSQRRFLLGWSGALAALIIVLGIAAAVGARGVEWRWTGRDPQTDQTFMRDMAAHHAQGIELATLAAERARDPHLRKLAQLMAASQISEKRVLDRWWQSWFGDADMICSSEDLAAMPGYLKAEEIARVKAAKPDAFDRVFVAAMTAHHLGAVLMSDDEFRNGSDWRLRIMAHAIRHAQRGEIALMNGEDGFAAVRSATANMFAPSPPAVRQALQRARDQLTQ